MDFNSLQTLPDGVNEMAERPAPSMDGRSVAAANNVSAGDMALENEFQKMLERERSRPSLLWDDRSAPQQERPQARQEPDLQTLPDDNQQQMYQYLQNLEAERQALHQYNQQMSEEARRNAQTAQYYQHLYNQQTSAAGGSAPQTAGSSSPENDIRYDVARTRLLAEAMDLERQYPGVFNRQEVAQYARMKGHRTLTDAWRNMIGERSLDIYHNNLAQQQAQEQLEYQQYLAWKQQGFPQYAPQQQYAPEPQQQQYIPQQAPAIEPPPSSEAVVMRPGARSAGSIDPADVRKPTSWSEVGALSMHDARRVFGPNI